MRIKPIFLLIKRKFAPPIHQKAGNLVEDKGEDKQEHSKRTAGQRAGHAVAVRIH
jgi:hypothetical protein